MAKPMDTDTIERCIRELLVALGDDPEREGLKDTPKRVARMFAEVFEGMQYTNAEIAEKFGTTLTRRSMRCTGRQSGSSKRYPGFQLL